MYVYVNKNIFIYDVWKLAIFGKILYEQIEQTISHSYVT